MARGNIDLDGRDTTNGDVGVWDVGSTAKARSRLELVAPSEIRLEVVEAPIIRVRPRSYVPLPDERDVEYCDYRSTPQPVADQDVKAELDASSVHRRQPDVDG